MVNRTRNFALIRACSCAHLALYAAHSSSVSGSPKPPRSGSLGLGLIVAVDVSLDLWSQGRCIGVRYAGGAVNDDEIVLSDMFDGFLSSTC